MARPSKDNPEWKQKSPAFEEAMNNGSVSKLLEALKNGLSRSSAIVFAGLSRPTVYDRMDKDETFRQNIEDAEEYRIAIVEDEKRKKIQDEHYRPAIEKELESSKFERYGKRERKDVNIEWSVDLKNLSDEELLKIIKGG